MTANTDGRVSGMTDMRYFRDRNRNAAPERRPHNTSLKPSPQVTVSSKCRCRGSLRAGDSAGGLTRGVMRI
jgi:hypothetical protein